MAEWLHGVLDLKSEGPGFKSRSVHYLELFSGALISTPRPQPALPVPLSWVLKDVISMDMYVLLRCEILSKISIRYLNCNLTRLLQEMFI